MREQLKEHLRRKLFERYQDSGDDTNIIPSAPDDRMSPVPPKSPFYPWDQFGRGIPWHYYYPWIRDNYGRPRGTWPFPNWNPYSPYNRPINFGDVDLGDQYFR